MILAMCLVNTRYHRTQHSKLIKINDCIFTYGALSKGRRIALNLIIMYYYLLHINFNIKQIFTKKSYFQNLNEIAKRVILSTNTY